MIGQDLFEIFGDFSDPGIGSRLSCLPAPQKPLTGNNSGRIYAGNWINRIPYFATAVNPSQINLAGVTEVVNPNLV